MMKATELMIGDWVWNTYRRKAEQVMEIYKDSVLLSCNDVYEYDEIEPIRLTPEILTKNDFAYNGLERGYIRLTALVYNELIGGDVVVKFQEGSAQVFIHAGFGLIGFIGTVSYVHELQHILRNFVEWEIDL